MGVSKVIYGDTALIDLSVDTVTAGKLRAGITAHGADGELITGTLLGVPEEPYRYDMNGGYVSNGVWYPDEFSTTYVDVYKVKGGHQYFVTLGQNVGTRFRVMYTVEDVTALDSEASVSGEAIVNQSSPSSYATFRYTPKEDGYLVIGKDSTLRSGIKTYVYDQACSWL